MTLFSGTFFPVDRLPGWMQPLAWVSPLWHGTELARGGRARRAGPTRRARPPGLPAGPARARHLAGPRPSAAARPMMNTRIHDQPRRRPRRLCGCSRPAATRAGRGLLLRSATASRRAWLAFCPGFFEPVFYLVAMGQGSGRWSARCPAPTAAISYAAFIAPGLLAASAMNGAVYDSTFNVFFKLKYAKPLRRDAGHPARPGGHRARRDRLGAAARRALRVGFLTVMAGLGSARLAVGAARAAGRAAGGVRVRGRRHGRHVVHAVVAGLRPGHARGAADVPVLHHVLPAVGVPGGCRSWSSACRCTTRWS